MYAEIWTLTLAVIAGTLSTLLALWLAHSAHRRGFLPERQDRLATPVEPVIFLFRDKKLVDATGPARTLLSALTGDTDWVRLSAFLAMRFPDCGEVITRAAEVGRAETLGGGGLGASTLRLSVDDLGEGMLRIALADPAAENAGITVDSHSLAAMEEELSVLRDTIDHAPLMIWREEPDGHVTWANAAYLREVEARADDETMWPMPRLVDLPRGIEDGPPRRVRLEMEGQTRWLDCHARMQGEQRMICALAADATVRAESSLREFVQTLTKTFADLPIGLAIFDRQRHLQLFNPALIDLTGVATGFLTARPTLYAFLDRLREARMVPEPKDYRSWRHKMTTLEAAAASGHHVETWTLPGGQTYRVTGRPHPDGAIAFLFEDITSEMSLTRRFRAELSLGRETLDRLDDALAVFEGGGRLVNMNAAYRRMWGGDLRPNLSDHLEAWRTGATSTGPSLQGLVQAVTEGATTSDGSMIGPNGGLVSWHVRALTNGRQMVTFSPEITANGPGTRPERARLPALSPSPALGTAPELETQMIVTASSH